MGWIFGRKGTWGGLNVTGRIFGINREDFWQNGVDKMAWGRF